MRCEASSLRKSSTALSMRVLSCEKLSFSAGHPGVGLWIEIGRATEDLRSNFVLLQMVFRRIQVCCARN